jgi:uncharacterized protein YcgL (UPF0745 family)
MDYYLYVNRDEGLRRIPHGLGQMLGRLQKVLELELDAGRVLAQADVVQVLRQIEAQGYYLQMPPRRGAETPLV